MKKHPYFILSDNQKKLKMKESVLDEQRPTTVKVIKETKLYYHMGNGDIVYKSSGHLKSEYYDDRKYRVYFDGE